MLQPSGGLLCIEDAVLECKSCTDNVWVGGAVWKSGPADASGLRVEQGREQGQGGRKGLDNRAAGSRGHCRADFKKYKVAGKLAEETKCWRFSDQID